MTAALASQVNQILATYTPANPIPPPIVYVIYGLQGETKSMAGIKAELRAQQETMGVACRCLKKSARRLVKPPQTGRRFYPPDPLVVG